MARSSLAYLRMDCVAEQNPSRTLSKVLLWKVSFHSLPGVPGFTAQQLITDTLSLTG